MSRIRLGLLFGGRSVEHEVSIQSARSILEALDPERYEIKLIGIDRAGHWRHVQSADIPEKWASLSAHVLLPPHPSSQESENRLQKVLEGSQRTAEALEDTLAIDVLFPIVHGAGGEDGSLQGLLELAEVAYVGSGVLGSAIQMDKDIAKKLLSEAGLSVLPWITFRRHQLEGASLEPCVEKIEQALTYPVFIKPANSGSSVGISRASNRAELKDGLQEALKFDDKLLIEQGIEAREVEVAVLGNEDPQASVPGEIIPSQPFYDYDAKYNDQSTRLLIPASLSEQQNADLRELGIKAFQALEAEGLARVDFLIDRESQEIYINELNSLPGFTEGSMYPLLWEKTGVSYPELLDRLIELALSRRKRRSHLQRQRGETKDRPL
ncbi:MAG: D-alanine--D-alanine ligase family protein [Myxococcota bacterium]|nr:D-alanine--D-alanine ligase A [Deltaproteobacteria bacterium]